MTFPRARISTRESQSTLTFCAVKKLPGDAKAGQPPLRVGKKASNLAIHRVVPLKSHGEIVIASLEPKVKELERQLHRCTVEIARLKLSLNEKNCTNSELNKRLKRTRQLKCAAEESLIALRSHQKAAKRTMMLQVRDHERYATMCMSMYEKVLVIMQQLIRTTHAGRKFVMHNCPDCGPKPIDEFGVRILPSGHLGFAPYCLVCINKRKRQAKELARQELRKTASELAQRNPKVARQLAARFDEEVAEVLEEMQAKEKV